jgi:hypothetical protein
MCMRTIRVVTLAALAASSSLAFAAPQCTTASQSKWMAREEMKAQIQEQGYTIERFLISGTCYEIYGLDKNGKKVEIYFDPVDGHVVKRRGG